MPHNLYLHSALVQSRKLAEDDASIRNAPFASTRIDSTVALTIAFFVNAAILVLAAMVFYGKTERHRPRREDHALRRQHRLDSRRLSHPGAASRTAAASLLFAIAPAGQRPGQHDHRHAGRAGRHGRLHALANFALGSPGHHPHPWPSCPRSSSSALRGDSSINDLLNLSQVVLALQLPLAMFPLLHFTSSRQRMGAWKSGWFLLIAGWGSAILITALDIYGLPDSLRAAWHVIAGG